ncbi:MULTISPECIES: alanyl-tRNA editing protein [Bacillus amyloliquefaciens group]|uniref:alanyl-tRNA editing protein n=1 Tax=Bacillus amyloliquefaciens group TaxID=1938374 RepID=UPI0007A5ECB3|nr:MULTISPECIES: alanyl-tRNA editing protein [Bacillus amyloliquefaciens group]MEA1006585.1 alanyl-tRNA editing protein [Bacillus velezensis]RCX30936.1 Ala-tRNA(Pro) hydrolase [Bacillus amyloliquefaciens]
MAKELYTIDSYQKTCEAKAISIEDSRVIFDQTIFYPEGGGQPSDKGIIQQGQEVYDVLKVSKKDGEVIHELDRPLKKKEQIVTMILDWEYRFEKMRYHTLLHVIAGVMYSRYNALATSSQIVDGYARIELAFPEGIAEQVLFSELEYTLKDILSQPKEVHCRWIDRELANQKDGMIKTTINLLPSSLQEIRIVEIDNIDEQACGGTHLKNTAEIGDFSVIKIQKKGANKRRLKIKLV